MIVFIIFAIRTIIDPMYRNPQLIRQTKQVFYVFIMPFYEIQSRFVGSNYDGSHKLHLFWTPLSGILCIIYISICGNFLRALYLLTHKKKVADEE